MTFNNVKMSASIFEHQKVGVEGLQYKIKERNLPTNDTNYYGWILNVLATLSSLLIVDRASNESWIFQLPSGL